MEAKTSIGTAFSTLDRGHRPLVTRGNRLETPRSTVPLKTPGTYKATIRVVGLPKRCIDISSHAHHRAVSRFGLTKAKSTATIRQALRQGRWYPSPDTPDEFLVLQRVRRDPLCVICAVEGDTVHVRTLYPLRNPGQLSPYKRQGGPFSADEIARHYKLNR